MRKVGDFFVADFFNNTGGLNTADSPFNVQDTQATGGKNWEYTLAGGVSKKLGATNRGTDASLRSLGYTMYNPSSGSKTIMRAADRKLQALSSTTYLPTGDLSQDNGSASTTPFATSTAQPVVFRQFNTPATNIAWAAGGGLTNLIGAYSSSKFTANGAAEPTGSISVSASGATGTLPAGNYYYAVGFKKGSTGAYSNAALDKQVAVGATNKVTIDLSSVTNPDSTTYTKIVIYRSAIAGVTGFTAGDLIVEVNAGTASYEDTGAVQGSSDIIPREANTALDNTTLARIAALAGISGTPNVNTIAVYKRRLVTAMNSTLFFSDVNKSESWPTQNYLVVPSGGDIKGLAVINFTSATSSTTDEVLAVFKDTELWIVTGSNFVTITDSNGAVTQMADIALKFVDNVGAPNQPMVVSANGYLAWISYRGPYIWDGLGKPVFAGRTIADLFDETSTTATIDVTKLYLGWGVYHQFKNQIAWVLSDTFNGENLYSLKMDLKLTLPNIQAGFGGRSLDAVLIQDVLMDPLYAGASIRPTYQEKIIAGDDAGTIFTLFDSYSDNGSGIDFQYETKFFDFGAIGESKVISKVIAWVEDTTDRSLTLDYWSQYAGGVLEAASTSAKVTDRVSEALYDVAYWDVAYYDNTFRFFHPIVFNLSNQKGANIGDCIKLRFKQSEANAPVTIAGFSVVFSVAGMRK